LGQDHFAEFVTGRAGHGKDIGNFHGKASWGIGFKEIIQGKKAKPLLKVFQQGFETGLLKHAKAEGFYPCSGLDWGVDNVFGFGGVFFKDTFFFFHYFTPDVFEFVGAHLEIVFHVIY
jgi:hypothetical protein